MKYLLLTLLMSGCCSKYHSRDFQAGCHVGNTFAYSNMLDASETEWYPSKAFIDDMCGHAEEHYKKYGKE